MIRPRNPLELAESQALSRIASLAASIMVSMRRPGRGVADSERHLRGWLQADGVEFGNDDLSPALALLQASKRVGRASAKKNLPRRVWLATDAPENGDGAHLVADADNADADNNTIDAVDPAIARPHCIWLAKSITTAHCR
jgi:hypothetical protein